MPESTGIAAVQRVDPSRYGFGADRHLVTPGPNGDHRPAPTSQIVPSTTGPGA